MDKFRRLRRPSVLRIPRAPQPLTLFPSPGPLPVMDKPMACPHDYPDALRYGHMDKLAA